MDEVEHGGRAGDLLETCGVALGRGLEVGRVHGHGMDLSGVERSALQAFPQVREIPVGVSGGRHTLIHLDHVHVLPWDVLLRQDTQHLPRRASAADGRDEAAARAHRVSALLDDRGRRHLRNRIGICQHFDSHARLRLPNQLARLGLCQPPGGATFWSTALGPHVFGSYAWTGVPAFSTGSTIRQASST